MSQKQIFSLFEHDTFLKHRIVPIGIIVWPPGPQCPKMLLSYAYLVQICLIFSPILLIFGPILLIFILILYIFDSILPIFSLILPILGRIAQIRRNSSFLDTANFILLMSFKKCL